VAADEDVMVAAAAGTAGGGTGEFFHIGQHTGQLGRGGGGFRPSGLVCRRVFRRITHGTGGAGGPGPAGEAIVYSACAEGETAAGTIALSSDGTPAGALTTAWVKAMRAGGQGAWKDLTYTQLLGRISRTVRQAAPSEEARVSVSLPNFHQDCRVRL